MDPTQGPTATMSVVKYADLPAATYTRATTFETPFPIASGTRDNCNFYFKGDDYQGILEGGFYVSQCQFVVNIFDVDLDDFGSWNYGNSC